MTIAKLLERVRLQAHFRQVLAELGGRDVAHLAAPQRRMRARLLVELAGYARARRFPRNRDFAERPMPYFVDASGTRCAMAHLIESTGERALVERIRATRNNAFVRELAGDLALQAWLSAAGLTAAEAARIQPSYCFVTKADACFCNEASAVSGAVIATATEQVMDGVKVTVESVHGSVGGIAVGQSITVGTESGAHPGDTLLVAVSSSGAMPTFPSSFRLDGDEVILNNCEFDVPVLSKADAIAALVAGETPDSCSDHLASVSSTWGQSQCDDDGGGNGGGCAIAGDASPLAIGTVLAAALWSTRRARAARG